MNRFEIKILQMGYEEDEIVAMDFSEERVVFYMTDGEIISIEEPIYLLPNKKLEA